MKELSLYHWAFIGEYLQDWDQTAAVKRAGYVGMYARSEGAKLMRHPAIKLEIDRVRAETVAKIKLSVQDVIDDIANVLRADPRDLVEHWQGACRYCFGYDHRYQRTPNEYRRDEESAAMKLAPFDPAGGVGFNPRREPNADCPECFGEGEPYERVKDTRELPPEAAALYIGVERTKHGIKVLTRSKDAAREAAAKFLGMNKETLQVLNGQDLKDASDAELEAIARGEKK